MASALSAKTPERRPRDWTLSLTSPRQLKAKNIDRFNRMFGTQPITPNLGSSPNSSIVRINGRTFDLPPLSPLASLQDLHTELSVKTMENMSLISQHATQKIQTSRTVSQSLDRLGSQSLYSVGSSSPRSLGFASSSIAESIGSPSPSVYRDPSEDESTQISANNPVHLVGPCFDQIIALHKRVEQFNIPSLHNRPSLPLSDLQAETDRIQRECRICVSFRPLTEKGGKLEKKIRRAM
jgi:hypothetical protein